MKSHFYIGLILLFSICLSSCSDDGDAASNLADDYPTRITPTLIAKGELDGNGAENISEQNLVIQNIADW